METADAAAAPAAAGSSSLDERLADDDTEPQSSTSKKRAHESDESDKQSSDESEDEDAAPKKRKLTVQEEMQLKMLASLPSLQRPLRDASGRRRSTFVSSEEIVEAGLSALVADHTAVAKEAPAGTIAAEDE